MHESEEKFTHKLPVPLPKMKQGDAGDMEDRDAVEEQAKEELRDATEADGAPLGHQ